MNSIIPNAGIVVEVLRGIQIGLAIFALFCLVMAIRELIGISRLQNMMTIWTMPIKTSATVK